MDSLLKNMKIKDSKEFKQKWHSVNVWLANDFPI